jgi:hypothetical protein
MSNETAAGEKTGHDRDRPTCPVHAQTELVETNHDHGQVCPRCEGR